MGILDPAKVTRSALQAAGSIAGLMITTEAMIADAPSDKAAAPDAGHGGMGGMGGMMPIKPSRQLKNRWSGSSVFRLAKSGFRHMPGAAAKPVYTPKVLRACAVVEAKA